jgi:hypothetical protein
MKFIVISEIKLYAKNHHSFLLITLMTCSIAAASNCEKTFATNVVTGAFFVVTFVRGVSWQGLSRNLLYLFFTRSQKTEKKSLFYEEKSLV